MGRGFLNRNKIVSIPSKVNLQADFAKAALAATAEPEISNQLL